MKCRDRPESNVRTAHMCLCQVHSAQISAISFDKSPRIQMTGTQEDSDWTVVIASIFGLDINHWSGPALLLDTL